MSYEIRLEAPAQRTAPTIEADMTLHIDAIAFAVVALVLTIMLAA